MTKRQLQKEWKKIISEIHNKPKVAIPYPPKVVFARELLIIAQVLLGNIESGEKVNFYQKIYRKTMSEYYREKAILNI